MPITISSDGQTLWKSSYASSPKSRLTLRVNGEEAARVITPNGTLVSAGFEEPEDAPTATDSGSGNVPDGFYYYGYVYASSQYPFVDAGQPADGLLYPRSNPSPFDAVTVSGASVVSVVIPTSQRGDVDTIFVYRTPTATTQAIADAYANAGKLYCVGSLANDSGQATVTFTDNNATDTGEALELDNFMCPLFRFTVYDGTYWWGFGNTDFVTIVELDGTENIIIDGSETWFLGRNGLKAKITGIDTGGIDGKGTFYFKVVGPQTAQLFTTEDLSGVATTINATGTATIRITAPASTLYRSKALNPFGWGRTTQILTPDGSDVNFVSDLWAEVVGGGNGTGLSLVPNERILKLDTEAPQKSYALDLTAAESDQFMSTLRTLDEAQSVSSQFSQFAMRLPGGQSSGTGINAKSLQILSSDATSQIPIGDKVIRTLRNTEQGSNAAHYFHGVYDDALELNCWWLKTTELDALCDTLIFQHAPTGQWGLKYWPWLSASATIFDPTTGRNYTLLGDEFGRLGFGFEGYKDWTTINYTESSVVVDSSILTINVPIIVNLTTISTVNGLSTAVCADVHGLSAGDEVFIAGTSGGGARTIGNVVAVTISSSTIFTFSAQHTGSYAETGGALTFPFSEMPGVLVKSGKRYVLTLTTVDDASYTAPGTTMEVQFSVPSGINIDTGDYETVEDAASNSLYKYTFLPGATACCARRHFNPPRLSTPKQNTELWSTLKNVEEDSLLRWTFYPGYANDIDSNLYGTNVITPTQETEGTLDTYFTDAPPNPPTRAFGIDWSEYGYDAYEFNNFTIILRTS